jgi:hypothetical protein
MNTPTLGSGPIGGTITLAVIGILLSNTALPVKYKSVVDKSISKFQ